MPVFTRQLRGCLRTNTAEEGVKVAYRIGLDKYPIFDENYRDHLNEQIIRRYYHDEHGFETTSMFKFYMDQRMREIMPRLNKMYLSTMVEFDPLSTIDIRTVGASESARDAETDSEGESDGTSKSRAVASAFPQQMLAENGDYAQSAQDNVSESGSTSANSSSSKENAKGKSESRTKGFQGSPAVLITAYRESLISVDTMVLNSLSDLFMSVWDTYDSRFTQERPNGYGYWF